MSNKDIEKFVTAVIRNMKQNGAVELRVNIIGATVVLHAYDKNRDPVRTHDLHRTRNVKGSDSIGRSFRAREALTIYWHWVKLVAKKEGLKC